MNRSTGGPPRALRLGLTGGIGSGKSTVAAMLARLGAAVVDADAIARSLTLAGGAAMPAIALEFGPAFVKADGAMDRDAMRELAFSDPAARRRLEAIVHPLISQETARRAAQAQAAGARCVVFDVPLLVESGRWRAQVDAVLVVDCSAQTQIERVMARSGWAREAVQKVLAQQASRAARLAAADVSLCNEALTLQALEGEVRQVWQHFGL
ncbi:MAG: dephospho-CoA kinase [Betaproteobacteria bacterium]